MGPNRCGNNKWCFPQIYYIYEGFKSIVRYKGMVFIVDTPNYLKLICKNVGPK